MAKLSWPSPLPRRIHYKLYKIWLPVHLTFHHGSISHPYATSSSFIHRIHPWPTPCMWLHVAIVPRALTVTFACRSRADALFNAVKKQYGLHSFLLPLQLPTSPPPDPVPVPTLPPRMPTASTLDTPPLLSATLSASDDGLRTPGLTPPRPPPSPIPRNTGPPPLANKRTDDVSPPAPADDYTGSTLRLSQDDILQIGRFVREFVTMSLVPWMEKCVVEWNESVRTWLFHCLTKAIDQVVVLVIPTSSLTTLLVYS